MKYEIKNRWTGEVIFTAEIDADENTPTGIKIGLAVRCAVLLEANLSGASLLEANLSEANLLGANLLEANLSGVNLSGANLLEANLLEANLSGVNLSGANLLEANLSKANLSGSNLLEANLLLANLSKANLLLANLSKANLSKANLLEANLSKANLLEANLSGANLSGANLSGVKNPPQTAAQYFSQFERDEFGFIVYRSQPGYLANKPAHWKWEPGLFLSETPNPCRTTDCGSGVNFSTLKLAKKNYSAPYWRCRVRFEDMADVVVPFNTDGRARCARLELLEIVS